MISFIKKYEEIIQSSPDLLNKGIASDTMKLLLRSKATFLER